MKGVRPCGTLGDPGAGSGGLSLALSPLCPSLQGPPTEEDFSEVLTQVQEVGSPRLQHGRGQVPSSFSLLSFPRDAVGGMACLRAFKNGVVTLTLLH